MPARPILSSGLDNQNRQHLGHPEQPVREAPYHPCHPNHDSHNHQRRPNASVDQPQSELLEPGIANLELALYYVHALVQRLQNLTLLLQLIVYLEPHLALLPDDSC